MVIPRTRGALSGVLLIALGAWGALAPLIGPSFGFTTDSPSTWSFTTETIWLSIVPGAVAVLGGLVLLTSAHRAAAALGAWLGIAAGAWLVVGDEVSGLAVQRAGRWEHLAAFDGLGALIAAIAAFALGRLAVRSVRDAELAREAELAAAEDDRNALPPRRTRESGRFDRGRGTPAGRDTAAPAVGGAAATGGAVRARDVDRDERPTPADRPGFGAGAMGDEERSTAYDARPTGATGADRTTVARPAGDDLPSSDAPPRAGAGPTGGTRTDTMTATERVREMSPGDSRGVRRRGGLLGRFTR